MTSSQDSPSRCSKAVVDCTSVISSPSGLHRPSFRIGRWVAEEVEEDGLGEGVELGEGGAALGPQRLRPVQHLRNPPLLRQRRQGNSNVSTISSLLTCLVVVPIRCVELSAFSCASSDSRESGIDT